MMLKVGVLGVGSMGNVHARHYRKMPNVELTFFDPHPERSSIFCERWSCRPCCSAEELLKTCDVVDICLPTDLHTDWGLRAIAAGKAVFFEKPLARTLEECRKIMEAAERAKVPCSVGHVVRFFPEYAKARQLVLEGAIGTPGTARTRRGGLAPTGSDSWFMDHSRSGGVLIDLAIHEFDWLRWTLGEVVLVNSRSLGAKTGQGPDYALTTLTFKSGAVAHVEATWMDPSGFRTTFEVAGSEGKIEFDSRNNSALRAHLPPKTFAEGPLHGQDDPYYRQLSAYIEAVEKGTVPAVTAEDGMIALSIAYAALESAKRDEPVRLEVDKLLQR